MSSTVEAQGRPFAAWIHDQRGGLTHAELSDALAEVVAAVVEHGKVGTLTLQVKIKPAGDGLTVFVTDTITAKPPQGDRSAALFFAAADGALTRQDPRQQELPLREVPRPETREAKS